MDSPFPEVFAPSLKFLAVPTSVGISARAATSLSGLSETREFVNAVMEIFLFLGPLLNGLLCGNVYPPSGPNLKTPRQTFYPLYPLPTILPFPRPYPQPLLGLSL